MVSKYRILGAAAIFCATSLTAVVAQSGSPSVVSGQREILLQTTQSWNGKSYTHYPKGQPETHDSQGDYRPAHCLAVAHPSVSKFRLCVVRHAHAARQGQR